MLTQYSTLQDVSAGERLLKIHQDGTAREYNRDFINLASHAPEIPELVLEFAYMNGLLGKIRKGVKMLDAWGLQNMMRAALKVEGWETEEALAPVKPSKQMSSGPSHTSKPISGVQAQTVAQPKPKTQPTFPNATQRGIRARAATNHGRLKPPFRRLTPTEVERWKAEGLCFKCDEKFHPNHPYAQAQLTVMLLHPNGVEEELLDEPCELEDTVEGVAALVAEVSVNSVVGISSPRTMKLRGVIQSREVVMLIDSGATHNFISSKLIGELKLPLSSTRSYGVLVAGGVNVQGRGVVDRVTLILPSCQFTTSFLPLELGVADIILGVQWLDPLGEMRVNWQQLWMKICVAGKWVELRGDLSLHSEAVSLKSLWKIVEAEGEGVLVEFGSLQGAEEVVALALPEEWKGLLQQYAPVFAEPTELPPSRGKEHSITLEEGARPVSVRPFRYPHIQKAEIERQIASMLATGIIQESGSPFSSSVLLVKKKDGSWRFCVDYRALNKVTVPDKYPIPMIDQLLDELHGAQVFSKLDLRSGYHQILVKQEDIPKTAFRTHDGHYEFRVMPFGLSNAPATFQALMNQVFRPYLRRFVLVFFDDILIYSRTVAEHKDHLETALKVLQAQKLYANFKKCQFGSSQVEYLGHVISGDGVAVDGEKVKAMLQWVEPKNVKELRGFLGLTGYYHKFVKDYGSIARPLTCLLRKEQFVWNAVATEAFRALQQAMTTVPVLAMHDFELPFVVESDASGFGLGAVLMQNHHPIAFFSQALTDRQRMKSIYERELMAIVFAVQKWRHYLLGRHFVVRTDQKSLRFLMEQREVNLEYQKWLTKLLGFDFEIVYKPGLENKAADALSRQVTPRELFAVSMTTALQLEEIACEVDKDPALQQLRSEVQTDATKHPDYSVVHGRLLRKGKLVLPKTSSLIGGSWLNITTANWGVTVVF